MIFLINALLEENVFIRSEALEKVLKFNRLLNFLDFKVGVYFNLRFQMQETDELNLHHHFHPATKGGLLYKLDVFCARYAIQAA